jgi:hypothetical protein
MASGSEIKDSQPPMRKLDAAARQDTRAVRSAMRKEIAQGQQAVLIERGRRSSGREDAQNAAHNANIG